MGRPAILVPKNKKAMNDFDYGVENINEFIYWDLTKEEFSALFKRLDLVNFINGVCDSWLDEAEEDDIRGLDNLQKLYNQISKKYDNTDPFLEKLLSFIQEAINRDTFIGFYL